MPVFSITELISMVASAMWKIVTLAPKAFVALGALALSKPWLFLPVIAILVGYLHGTLELIKAEGGGLQLLSFVPNPISPLTNAANKIVRAILALF